MVTVEVSSPALEPMLPEYSSAETDISALFFGGALGF